MKRPEPDDIRIPKKFALGWSSTLHNNPPKTPHQLADLRLQRPIIPLYNHLLQRSNSLELGLDLRQRRLYIV